MSSRPWYRRYGSDFIAGTLGLTLEEKGAYSIILDLMYDRGRPIPDDPRYIAGVCGCSIRKWSAIRARLVALGKIQIVDGSITNRRAERELENDAKASQKLAESGSKGGQKRAENAAASNPNRGLAVATLKHRAHKPEPDPELGASSLRSDAEFLPADRDVLTSAFDAYNSIAAQVGWPKAVKLNRARQVSLKARLADAGGLEGWRAALNRARDAPCLTGRNDRGWVADLDFFLQPQSFLRLIEGRYDQRSPKVSLERPTARSGHDALGAAIGAIFGSDHGDQERRVVPQGDERDRPGVDCGAAGGALVSARGWP
ncbi:YdaU family protein [Chthonobacter rhizosphaerae]|uniref:YdaU family protein n=1 Tax=Chthonobacter rhizosphaerae TaxID=2735553 RepID=UPI0015EF43E0|nr:YdaU family protein [Chthonobacter rhizosphaerae]